jgi:hypothetical protein
MAVPVHVTGAVAVGLSVMEVGLAASAVIIRGAAKIIVKTKTAPAATPSVFKALCDLRVLDFLITNVSSGGVGFPAGLRRNNLASPPNQVNTGRCNVAAGAWLILGWRLKRQAGA